MAMSEDIAANKAAIDTLRADNVSLKARVDALEAKVAELNPNLTAQVIELDERVTINTERIDQAAHDALERTQNVEQWLQAYEEGPIGNLPWPTRPVPPPISNKVAVKRQEARRNAIRRGEALEPDQEPTSGPT